MAAELGSGEAAPGRRPRSCRSSTRRSPSAPIHAARGRLDRSLRRRGARPGRRERSRQVDAGQDLRRRAHARQRAAARQRRRGGARRPRRGHRAPGSRSSTRSRRCSPTSRSSRTSSSGGSRCWPGRRIDRGAMSTQAQAIFKRLGVPLDPDRIARGLSIAEQQLVEIAKALSLDARVIVMDEPTAALSAVEVERLFGVAATLRESRRRRALHLAPARGGLRALPARDRPPRRAPRADARVAGLTRRRPDPRDGRPRSRRARHDELRRSARPCSTSSA